MKLNLIRRICALAALSAVALTGVIVSADPLPVPDMPKVFLVPAPLSPPNGVTANIYNTVFTWSHVGMPDMYILKLTIVETGKVINMKVPLANCSEAGFCTMAASNVPTLFDQVKDGYKLKWLVIAKYGVNKVKGTARKLIVDTVNAPTNLLPADGTLLMAVHNLSWTNHNTNQSYVLVVRNTVTGALIAKQKLSSGICAAACAVSAASLGLQQVESSLSWSVKAIGFNGNVAKSAKQTFFTLGAAA